MERTLGLMAGAGVLPGRAAAEAARQGWRVVAFSFEDAPGLAEQAAAVIPSRIDRIQAVLEELLARQVSAALFVGKFWKQRVFEHRHEDADGAARALAQGGLSDGALTDMVVTTLAGLGIEVLDQRTFLSPWMARSGVLTARTPTDSEWTEIRHGFTLARHLAGFAIGQTVVRSLGVTVAVEAAEGTDETIRRGGSIAGPGTVVVKAVGASPDYRFDIPTVGSATIHTMIEVGATALGMEGGKMLLVDRDEVLRLADGAGIAMVSIDEPSGSG
ncbi:MAG TPA: UDP-2,3-diacylglucosamine diphosphatase LpxI [Candidatus Methylomirabilis sp.]|nr:UDP-2,3-diacylglucosamine diphosphatase LpxI [Candidatus Methylomirabilis sp.]